MKIEKFDLGGFEIIDGDTRIFFEDPVIDDDLMCVTLRSAAHKPEFLSGDKYKEFKKAWEEFNK